MKKSPTLGRIVEIEAELKVLGKDTEAMHARIATLQDEAALLRSPFKPGQLISWMHGNKRVPGIVKDVMPGWNGFSLAAQRILANGTASSSIMVLHPYHKVEAR